MTDLNTMFPGRADYVGPTAGIFGLLHHDRLYEESHDVVQRVDYVRREKAANEIAIRLHNMIYLGSCQAAVECVALDANYAAAVAVLDADYAAAALAPLHAAYRVKRAQLHARIVAYIKERIPDCAGNGRELVFEGFQYTKARTKACKYRAYTGSL